MNTKKIEKAQQAVDALYKAEEAFLVAFGWKKVRLRTGIAKHWTPKKRTAYVFPGDRVLLSTAMDAQKTVLAFEW